MPDGTTLGEQVAGAQRTESPKDSGPFSERPPCQLGRGIGNSVSVVCSGSPQPPQPYLGVLAVIRQGHGPEAKTRRTITSMKGRNPVVGMRNKDIRHRDPKRRASLEPRKSDHYALRCNRSTPSLKPRNEARCNGVESWRVGSAGQTGTLRFGQHGERCVDRDHDPTDLACPALSRTFEEAVQDSYRGRARACALLNGNLTRGQRTTAPSYHHERPDGTCAPQTPVPPLQARGGSHRAAYH